MTSQPFDPGRPFLRSELSRAHANVSLLRRRDYRRVLRGVWVAGGRADELTLIRAALLLHGDGAYASHLSAAAVRRLPIPDHPFAHITVTAPDLRRYRPQIKNHVRTRQEYVESVHGIAVTGLVDTFIGCAGMLGLVDLVILGDAMVRRYAMSAGELTRACERSRSYYAKRALAGAALVRDGVDSVMETRLRLLLVLAGLPEPEVDVRIYWDDGTLRRRFDLCYRSLKLIVEYDGRQHAEDAGQWEGDIARREEFDDEGYRILVVTARGIFREPERTLQRVRRQLMVRGWGDVPHLDDGWREHFAA